MAFNAAKLIQLRKERSWTQDEVVEKTGIRLGTYRDIEQGKSKDPSLDTVRKLAELFGIAVDEFINGGYVPKQIGRPRLPQLPPVPTFDLPNFGEVPCGPPEIQFTNPPGFTSVSASQYGDDRFVLRAKGDSMTGRNIQSGDLLIFRRADTADHGDVVVAWTGNGTTVKVYHERGERPRVESWLYPASEHGKPAMMTEEYRIIGVLKGVIRDVQPEQPTASEPVKKPKRKKN